MVCDFCKKSYKKLYWADGHKYCFGCRCSVRHCKGCGKIMLHTEGEPMLWARYYCTECSTNGKDVHIDRFARTRMKHYERDQETGEWTQCSGTVISIKLPKINKTGVTG